MSLSLQVDIGQRSLAIKTSRIGRLLSSDKDYATHLGIWDRIKDFFRPYNKSEALDNLYRLIHSDNPPETPGDEAKLTPLYTAINAFNNLKALAKDDDKALFHIRENHYHGVNFYIGDTCVKSLDNIDPDHSPVSALAVYYLQQVTQHPDVKQHISQTVRDLLANDSHMAMGNTAPHRLLIDMWRLSNGSIIDGRPLYDGVSRMTEGEITDVTNGLYQKLTPPQRAALVELGSQSGFADVHQGLASFPNAFIDHFVLGGISTAVELLYHPENACLTVRQTTRRLMSEQAHLEFNSNDPGRDIYPHLQMGVTFTIPPDGLAECVDFYASEQVNAARYPAAGGHR
ncbi:hypothetical protein [Candidatus Sodalis sp. SoCistrobi]|uniref:hypothetical protein n=1 Tax=Candidatus Sodalis sp. SoCistrobi TaxID=1922216 RepID=UPI00093D45FF|nr:hypothetical protein [Candidatus Sodalis sp. SoCistrobi]